jgi:hypothetical protein
VVLPDFICQESIRASAKAYSISNGPGRYRENICAGKALPLPLRRMTTSLRIDLVKPDVVKVEHAGMGIGEGGVIHQDNREGTSRGRIVNFSGPLTPCFSGTKLRAHGLWVLPMILPCVFVSNCKPLLCLLFAFSLGIELRQPLPGLTEVA